MTFDIAPHLSVFVAAFALLALVGVAALVSASTAFFRTHRAVRVRRHEAVLPYYRGLALHH